MKEKMKIYAHRGYSGKYPENTMLAFREAACTGCYGIEMDVQLTKDGKVVVIHDEAIDRTTDGTGWVKDYTYEEISRFNAGKSHPQHGFQPIPSLEEYCSWARSQDLVTNIELKTGIYYYEGLEEKTLEAIQKYHMEDKVLFSSFNHLSLVRMKELAPHIPCGALLDHRGLGNGGHYCQQFHFEYYHPGYQGLTWQEVEKCREHGVGVNVWTVDDMGTLEQIAQWGCQGAISNYPGACQRWLDGGLADRPH